MEAMAAPPTFERLSALDSVFLDLEDGANHMHVAALMIFEGAPLRRPDGEIDLDRLRRHTEWALGDLPRWRQRLAHVPLLRDPVWVDDDRFDLDAHVRHARVPGPGDLATLRSEVGRLLSVELDRRRPLWELWALDGLADGRVAVLVKVHHAMVDGVAGIALMSTLLQPAPREDVPRPAPWSPRPAPSRARLLTADVRRRAEGPRRLWRKLDQTLGHRGQLVRTAIDDATGIAQLLRTAALPTTRTVLNPPEVGPRRSFDWVRHDLGRVKAVKRAARATVNDVVLATVAGGARRFLERHGCRVDRLRFRVMVPVALPGGRSWGNRVSLLLAPLPIDEPDPNERLLRVRDTMLRIKSTGESRALALGEELADWTVMSSIGLAARLAMRWRPYNLIVTNVPGPGSPLYLLGARMLEAYPMVPLYGNQAAGIALLSYDGALHWGIDADRDRLPDLHELVEDLDDAFRELWDAWAPAEQEPAALSGRTTGGE